MSKFKEVKISQDYKMKTEANLFEYLELGVITVDSVNRKITVCNRKRNYTGLSMIGNSFITGCFNLYGKKEYFKAIYN